MTDIFDQKALSPMLIKDEVDAFDSSDYLYELKLDGIRCLAYLDGCVDLRNKRNIALASLVPELNEIHKAVRGKCILDGELIVLENGKPCFERVQSRVQTTNGSKIAIAQQRYPVTYVAFDILYQDGVELAKHPLIERKQILRNAIDDTPRMSTSGVFEQGGIALFQLTKEQGLEGVVAKRRQSLYFFGKETNDWVKFKNLVDEDFLACGYIRKDARTISLILGSLDNDAPTYKGHVTLGVTLAKVSGYPTVQKSPFGIDVPRGNENAVWFAPPLPMCTVVYMERTSSGGMRQPRLKRIGFI